MSLRLRLVVVFFLVSVVPLGAVTWYTYTNNLRAVRETAQREADILAAELGQRMEVVTAQLSMRVGELVTLAAAPRAEVPPPAQPATEVAAAEAEAGGFDGAELAALDDERVRNVLGEMAVLLDNVEIFDRRGRGRPGGRGGPPPDTSQSRDATAPTAPDAATAPERAPVPDGRPRFRPADGNGENGPPVTTRNGGPGRGGPDPSMLDPDRILIDMEPIRRDIVRQVVPEGQWDELTPEERARVFAEVQQRMLGIRQGIDIIRQQVAERAAAAALAPPDVTSAPLDAPPPAPAAPEPPPAPASPAEPPELQRRSELSRGRIDISLERDGEVLGQANAAINLSNLLGMLFTNTRRESGEVPFAIGMDGRVFAPTEREREVVRGVSSQLTAPAEPANLLLPDWVVVTRPDPTNQVVTFGIARPLGGAVEELRQTAVRNAGFGLGFIALALVLIVPLSGRLTRNLDRLSVGVNRIAQGDYSARVDVGGHDEVGRLASAFNRMAAEVESHQRAAVAQERIRHELELGRQIQHDMLPHAPLRVGASEVMGLSVAAREVGGDFFNYFRLSDGTIALLIGDVSGKGVGAALLMANLQAALRTRLTLGQDLAVLACELDEEIDRSTPGPVYATLFLGILDPARHVLQWVNAGHNPQYVVRADGRLERLESMGRPIGLLAGGGYGQRTCELGPGDLLFCYTDGCVDAEDEGGGMFGAERLEGLLRRSAGRSPEDVIATVRDAMGRFRGGAELQDDATMMSARIS